jgi:hypothetical protein
MFFQYVPVLFYTEIFQVLQFSDRNSVEIMIFEVNNVVTVRNGFLGCGLLLSGKYLAMFPMNILHQISGHGCILLM